jgi:hypothetical protein
MEYAGDGLKQELVGTFTGGRTTSLREMKPEEYDKMCASMEAARYGVGETDFKARLRKSRSAILKQLQKMGIDTSDFANVDRYCLHPRIAGKVFRSLTIEEMAELMKKLKSIARKNALHPEKKLCDFKTMNWN